MRTSTIFALAVLTIQAVGCKQEAKDNVTPTATPNSEQKPETAENGSPEATVAIERPSLGQAELEIYPDRSQVANVVILNQKPTFYKGTAPLEFKKAAHPFGRNEKRDVVHDFGDWVNLFIYSKEDKAYKVWHSLMSFGIATGARAIEPKSRRTVAEAQLLGLLNGPDGELSLSIEEFHYDVKGNVTFHCESNFGVYSGLKTAEKQSKGKKERDYFFIWPVDD